MWVLDVNLPRDHWLSRTVASLSSGEKRPETLVNVPSVTRFRHVTGFRHIRVAVCGRKTAPPLFGTLEALGRETCLRRIGQAIGKLKAS